MPKSRNRPAVDRYTNIAAHLIADFLISLLKCGFIPFFGYHCNAEYQERVSPLQPVHQIVQSSGFTDG
jgi:hypothetical protein